MLTRRTLRRHFLLRPDAEVGQIDLYLFAVLAKKYQIRVHSLAVLSNHKHDMVTDVLGQRPKFVAELHRLVALCVKSLRKWDGPLWGIEETSVVDLETPEAIVTELGYIMTQPTTAGIVRRPEQWPGVCTTVDDLGRRVYRIALPGSSTRTAPADPTSPNSR